MALQTRTERLGLNRAAVVGLRLGVVLGVVLGACGAWLGSAPVAYAAGSSYTWAGGSPGRTESAAHWSAAENWEGGKAPSASQAIETLTFPHLSSGLCTSEPPADTCYLTLNDLADLSVESLQLDDGDDYLLAGAGITLGSGGLTAEPSAGASGSAGAFIEMPIQLGAAQKWSVTDRGGGEMGENALLLFEELSGAEKALTLELSDGPALVLANETEVGPLTIEGGDAGGQNVANGLVLLEGELNASDDQSVKLSHVYLEGAGAVGPLTTDHASLLVDGGAEAPGALEAASVKLDPETAVGFEITGEKTIARTDYSQLVARGLVELAGPIVVLVGKPSEDAPCPELSPGQKFTFVSTTGALLGTFGNAPEGGQEIKLDFEKGCDRSQQTMRIGYSRVGGTETVTGTVEAHAKEEQEAEAREREDREHREKEVNEREVAEREATTHEQEAKTKREAKVTEEADKKLAEESARKAGEEAAAAELSAARTREAEALVARSHAEEAAAARKHEEESLARGGVLASKETSKPKPPARAELLAKGLRQCRRQSKKKRAKCEAAVRKKYGVKAKGKRGAKK